MSIRIRIEHGQDAGKTWRLRQPGVYVVGRNTSSDLRVLDMKVSKTHAEVHLVEEGGTTRAVLRDLGSTHGSLVNGQPVHGDAPLAPGDELRLGLTILRVLSDGEADEEPTPAAGRAADQESRSTAARQQGRVDTSTSRTLPPDALVGQQLGGYRVEQKIGKGGMGAVYLAEQISLNRQVALKVLSNRFVKDKAFVDQFVNEARAAGALNHPNVVQVYDVGEADGHYYFSMEFVAGGSLEERMRRGEPFGWQDALNWFLDATNALVFAKRRGILHRDVKPDNLMISEDGSAKLCDLGLAKRFENRDLMDQGIIGTPHFISPEAIRRKTDIDARTDLYSLGCTFFRILTGRNPYPGKTVKDILLGHLNQPVPHVNDRNKEVPKELDEIVFRLMQKEPEARFQSPEELLAALDKVRVRHGLEAHGIAPRSGRRWIVVAVVAVLLAAGAAIFALNQESTTVTVEDPEAIRAREQAARRKILNDYDERLTDAERELTDLRETVTNLKAADTIDFWSNPKYAAQAEAYDDYVDRWTKRLATWGRDRAKYEHEAILAKLDEVVEAVKRDTDVAQNNAEVIRSTIKKRKATQAERRQTRATSLADITKALDERRRTLDALSDGGPEAPRKWLELAKLLGASPEEARQGITDLVQPIFDGAAVDGEPVLDWKKDVKPLIDERFPTKTLKRWLETPPKLLGVQAGRRLSEARAKTRAEGRVTPESLQAGIDLVQAWIDLLPENPEPADLPIAKAIHDHRQQARKLEDEFVTARRERIWLRQLTDRVRYHRMLLEVRAPLGYGDGHWYQFQHAQAKLTIQSWAEAFETPGYQALGKLWMRDTLAFTRLFHRLKDAWDADKWGGERNVVYTDDGGKQHKCRCQRVELDRLEITRRDEVLLYADLGPKRLLDHVFHGEQHGRVVPRFAFEGEDFRGLALLAEMAADFERAATWWRAYQAPLAPDAPGAADARHHLALLPAERQAGETWVRVQELRRQVAAVTARFRGPVERIPEDEWRRFLTVASKLNVLVGQMQEGWDLLLEAKDFAASVWAASLREVPHPTAAYAGDEMPRAAYDKLIRRAWRLALPDEPVPPALPKPKQAPRGADAPERPPR